MASSSTPLSANLSALRQTVRLNILADETSLTHALLKQADMGEEARDRAQDAAAAFVISARNNSERSGLIDKFLQEYGLSTAEGVTLMRLAEALLRTPDVATADTLIRDKVEAGDWSAHRGKSPFPLVNFSTNALMLTAAWLDEVDGNNPAKKMIRATKNLLDRVGEPVIRASVAQAMKIMGEHFVLGETINDAMRRGKDFAQKGYGFSFDMLGEAAHTADDAEKYFSDYQTAIRYIADHCHSDIPADNPGISVKLSALHPRYEYAKRDRILTELGPRLKSLAHQARAANMGFNIDAEEADRLDLSLDLIEMMMRDDALDGWQGFGIVIQAYQRRASFVIDWLAALARHTKRRIMVRLVKGAYWDSEIKRAQTMGLETYPVFTRKVLTDLSYLACAKKLFTNSDVFFPQFATHNALTATSVCELAQNTPFGVCTEYEVQRLHGMGEQLHDTLINEGIRSRIYAPVGGHKELLPYLVRRLLENGANSSFVNQLIDPDLSVEDIVTPPFVEASALSVIPNPAIPSPRDLFTDEKTTVTQKRKGAKGIDLTDPNIAQAFSHKKRLDIPKIDAQPICVPSVDLAAPKAVTNPADRTDILGHVREASADSVADSVRAARDATPSWQATPPSARAALLRKAANQLEDRMVEFMTLCVFEAGKTWEDAIAEVREAVDFCRYYADQIETLSCDDHYKNYTPLGVVVCISPWNFPLAIFLGQISAALASGNCVIAKPAEQTPLIAYQTILLLHKAGIPKEVLQFLPGAGETVGDALVRDPGIDGVIFTGSTPVAKLIDRALCTHGNPQARLIAETGGINAMIIDSTALLEQAVTDCIASAFQSAGQRCSACRLVCVQSDIADQFMTMLKGAMAELVMDNPALRNTDIGPVIDDDAKITIDTYIKTMKANTDIIATVPLPASTSTIPHSFVQAIACEIESVSACTKEVFGPVLHVVRYEANALDRLVQDINDLGFGLTMGVHTRIDETMHKIVDQARVGNIYVNRNQIGALVGVQPFGGERLSGTGPKAGGPQYLRAMMRSPNAHTEISRSHDYASLNLPAKPMTDEERAAVNNAHQAFRSSSSQSDFESFLAQSVHNLPEQYHKLISTIRTHLHKTFAVTLTLPGPTGESNTLRLKGRGIILCLGNTPLTPAPSLLIHQVLLSLMAGNSVICADCKETRALKQALAESGLNHDLLQLVTDTPVSQTILLHKDVSAIALDEPTLFHRLHHLISQRDGPIIPIVSVNNPAQFAVERTLTINTTAAGGDVRLLSLGS